MFLADRYHELMGFRAEAFAKYRANAMSTITGPKARAYLPVVKSRKHAPKGSRGIGSVAVLNFPPVWHHVCSALTSLDRKVRIVEVGPGKGELAEYLLATYPDRISNYYGLERDRNVIGPYERIDSPEQLPGRIDMLIASEVAEHMTADEFYSNVLVPFRNRLAPDAIIVVCIPNPTAPGGIARDFSHLQNYPWYDMYAIMRLEFKRVDVVRTMYLWTLPRLLFFLPRVVLCTLLELDWCEGLVFVASGPRSDVAAAPAQALGTT
ncbi:MAG: methyltransferase domain-containing protein [Vulcanimicrobiaceae bacterium]